LVISSDVSSAEKRASAKGEKWAVLWAGMTVASLVVKKAASWADALVAEMVALMAWLLAVAWAAQRAGARAHSSVVQLAGSLVVRLDKKMAASMAGLLVVAMVAWTD